MKNPIIRPIFENEIDECISVIQESFATVAAEFGLTKENTPTNAAFIEKKWLISDLQNGEHFFALFLENKIIGFLALKETDKNTYELKKLSVLPKFRHQGFGKTILNFCKAHLSEKHATCLKIGIINENKHLKNWYITNGFQETETKTFPHLPFTVCLMEQTIV